MISRIETSWRSLRRALSQSEWLTRILRFEKEEGGSHQTGLIMIQIDGLSHGELKKALARREMPFLRRLIDREYYGLRRMYAGVPATTSAVQAELFYGVPQAVPGFSFYDRDSQKLVTMIEPTAARNVEQEMNDRTEGPLLQGGSSYANNYSGGANEPHFCPTSRGWGQGLREAPAIGVLALVASHLFTFLRTVGLACIEFLVALVDMVRGVISGKSLLQELKFVPTRVAITVVLRELAVSGVKIDIVRGLPVIHANFLGYDEQSHRRGPKSAFAHLTLKGIDRAIRRISRAAKLSRRRIYELWIYSDHGQEVVVPYEKRFGRPFADAVHEVFSSHAGKELNYQLGSPWGSQLHRAGNLGTRLVKRLVPEQVETEDEDEAPSLTIASLGPVAMIYWRDHLSESERSWLAKRLVAEARVPAVLYLDNHGTVHGWHDGGHIRLPEDGEKIIEEDHPFLHLAIEDLTQLCSHKNAGDFVVLGRSGKGETAVTFASENGAHGGAGPEETSAFALLPRDTEAVPDESESFRVRDLRQAAMHIQHRAPDATRRFSVGKRPSGKGLRVVTYNVHSCLGMDGRLSPRRIARVIARCRPDVVCLQEVDVHRERSGDIDQAHQIAEALDMDFHFHPAMQVEEERYGDAVLTRLPMRRIRAGSLPHWRDLPGTEPRGAIWVEVEVDGTPVQIFNTHLSLRGRDRKQQVDALLGPEWLGHKNCRNPVILCGDLNALPRSYVYKRLSGRLSDAQGLAQDQKTRATFATRFPTARIDHVFVDSSLEVRAVEVPNNHLSRMASDHLPLVVELRLSKVQSATRSSRARPCRETRGG